MLDGSESPGRRASALERARALRTGQTEAERRLWYVLRAGRFMALKFRRQKPVGPFIADFICLELGLVIEVDGGQHGSSSDERRDRWFAERGYTVLRFWNNEVLGQTEAVLERIRETVLAFSPNPSPVNGRGAQDLPLLGSPLPFTGEGLGEREAFRSCPIRTIPSEYRHMGQSVVVLGAQWGRSQRLSRALRAAG